MLDNMFEESYVQEMLEHVKLLTEKDTINKTLTIAIISLKFMRQIY